MAIKGKKKSQARGSQARRRPAAMPRPVAAARKPPWYQTTAGLSIASIGGIILLIIVAWLINVARANSREAEQLRDGLDSYTGSVKAVLQTISGPATDMTGFAAADPTGVAEDAEAWIKTLEEAQVQMQAVTPPVEVETANDIFLQAIASYLNAARLAALAGDLPTEDAGKLLATTLGDVTTATALWDTAVRSVDEARSDAKLGSSGLRSPASGPAPQPTPQISIPPQDDGGSGDNSGGGGGNGGGGGGDKDGGGNG